MTMMAGWIYTLDKEKISRGIFYIITMEMEHSQM